MSGFDGCTFQTSSRSSGIVAERLLLQNHRVFGGVHDGKVVGYNGTLGNIAQFLGHKSRYRWWLRKCPLAAAAHGTVQGFGWSAEGPGNPAITTREEQQNECC